MPAKIEDSRRSATGALWRNAARDADARELNDILVKLERLHHIRDLSTLLDSILFETRSLASADAGSIFLVESGRLKFSYVQNDTLFRNDFLASKYIYSNSEVAIDQTSLAGYVHVDWRVSILVGNAYALEGDIPDSFNPYFDEISSYRTKSMLIVPLRTSKNDLVGVLEVLINRLGPDGSVLPFTESRGPSSRSSPSTPASPSSARSSCARSCTRWCG